MSAKSVPTQSFGDWQSAKQQEVGRDEDNEDVSPGVHAKPTVTPESLVIIKRGQKALKDLDKDKNWHSWLQVGEAIVECRTLAMRQAGGNAPYGRAYTAAFGYLMEHYKFVEHIKDKADRQKLVAIMDNLPDIEAWRATLSKDDRRRWNHPTTVYRQWQKAKKEEAEAGQVDDDLWRKPSLKDQNKALKAEMHELRKGGHLPWGPNDTPDDKARALEEQMGTSEAEEVALAILRRVKERRDADGRNRGDDN